MRAAPRAASVSRSKPLGLAGAWRWCVRAAANFYVEDPGAVPGRHGRRNGFAHHSLRTASLQPAAVSRGSRRSASGILPGRSSVDLRRLDGCIDYQEMGQTGRHAQHHQASDLRRERGLLPACCGACGAPACGLRPQAVHQRHLGGAQSRCARRVAAVV